MNVDFLKKLLAFVVLLFAQALVLQRIHLFDYATPLLYVYLVLLFRRNYPRWGILLWSFAMGLAVDMFSNTPGVTASSMTFLGLLQPYVLSLFVPREAPDDLEPSVKTLGKGKYFLYALLLTFIYCLLFFTVEFFSFFNWMQWLACVGGSTMLTAILIFIIDNVRKS